LRSCHIKKAIRCLLLLLARSDTLLKVYLSRSLTMFGPLVLSEASYLDIAIYGTTRSAAGLVIIIAAAITTFLIVTVPLQLHRISFAPKNIPWVGQKNYTWLAKLRSTLVALKYERINLEAGWEEVCPCSFS
jgi:hypothetical protein